MSMSSPGWYPDPYRVAEHRWWDGTRWTESVAGVPVGAWMPVAVAPRASVVAHPTLPLVVAVGAVLCVAVPTLASRFVLRALTDEGWPIVAYVALATVLGYGPVLLWCAYASRRWGSGRLRTDSGLAARWADAGWGPLTWISCVVTQVFVGMLIVSSGVPMRSNTEGISELRDDRAYVISLLIVAVVAAPIVEEIVFRGFVMRGLLSRLPVVAAVGAQGVLFGLAHVDPARGMGNIGLVIVLSSVGGVLGGAAYLLRRLGPTMIAHAIMNAVALALVLSGVLDRLQ